MKKINFNDRYLLTKAVLEGRKTQTRRIARITKHQFELLTGVHPNAPKELIQSILNTTSKYKVGEVVAVAQSYKDVHEEIEHETIEMLDLFYSAGWKNKMFTRADLMQHQIQITNVRIERLQDIDNIDCIKEGIEYFPNGGRLKQYAFYDTKMKVKFNEWETRGLYRYYETPRKAYADLIDRVSGKGTWENNPYVFVYDFKLIK